MASVEVTSRSHGSCLSPRVSEDSRFGSVDLGVTRESVARAFGAPDDREARAPKDGVARIWRYGDIEFHFDGAGGDASLWLIHSDGFAVPQGGPSIDLDAWILSRSLRREFAERELAAAGVAYTVRRYDYDQNADEIRTSAGGALLFAGEDGTSPRDRLLVSIFLSKPSRGPSRS